MDYSVTFIQTGQLMHREELSLHLSDSFMLILSESDDFPISIFGKSYNLTKNTLLFLSPKSVFSSKMRFEFPLKYISFNTSNPEAFLQFRSVLNLSEGNWAIRFFHEIVELFNDERGYLCNSLLRTLLQELMTINESEWAHSDFHPALRMAVEKLERHYAKDWSISDLAAQCQVSESYLRTLFEIQFNLSPQKYLQNCRMTNARKMLQETDCPIVRIGQLCGYGDKAYFTRLFRQLHHCTPSQYRWMIKTGIESE